MRCCGTGYRTAACSSMPARSSSTTRPRRRMTRRPAFSSAKSAYRSRHSERLGWPARGGLASLQIAAGETPVCDAQYGDKPGHHPGDVRDRKGILGVERVAGAGAPGGACQVENLGGLEIEDGAMP